jgi:hypothetical protein
VDFKKHSLILSVIQGLNEKGSWTGKTHVQKTLFLLHSAIGKRLPFEFILYKHGPFSFDVEEEMEQMRGYEAIHQTPIAGYGVTLKPGEMTEFLHEIAPLDPDEITAIEKVCRFVDSKDVKELERLATAAWIRSEEGLTDHDEIATRLHFLKPHISEEAAKSASEEVLSLFK